MQGLAVSPTRSRIDGFERMAEAESRTIGEELGNAIELQKKQPTSNGITVHTEVEQRFTQKYAVSPLQADFRITV